MLMLSIISSLRRVFVNAALLLGSAVLLIGCGGGGSTEAPVATDASASIEGVVIGPNGSPVVGASVRLTSASQNGTATTSDADGKYRFAKLGVDGRWIVRVEAPGMATLLRPVATRSNQLTAEDFALYPEGARALISSTDAATVTDSTSGARLQVPSNAWRREDGAAISGPLTVSITSVSPELAASRMPGDFTTIDSTGRVSQIESFGAVTINVTDSTGQRVNLNNGSVAQLRIPASSRGDLPATVGLYSLDETTGRWNDEGTATLSGSGDSRWYEASVTHLSSWNADRPLTTVYVEGCLLNDLGQPAPGRIMIAEGLDYSARTGAVTNAEGRYRIPVKRGGQFRIELQTNILQAEFATTAPVVAGPSEVDFQVPTCQRERKTLGLAPVIVQQPLNVSLFDGSTARFSVVVDGGQPLRYQWQKDGDDIVGASGPVLVLRANLADSGSVYKVNVSNSLGSATSDEARLTVTPVPVIGPGIATQPSDRSVTVGGVGVFSVVATGSVPMAYQWFRNDVAIVGETAAELRFAATLADNRSLFTVRVSNGGGSIVSRAATLTVLDPAAGAPVIVSEPFSITSNVGETARFTVVAQGEAPLTYQWRRNGVAIGGANEASYSLVTTLADSGSIFSVLVSNGRGSASSVGAILTVIQPRLTGTLAVTGDAAEISNGTFTATDPESTFGLSGPICFGDSCISSLGMNGKETERTQLARFSKNLILIMPSTRPSPGAAPGTQPDFVSIAFSAIRFEGTSISLGVYSSECPATLPNCQSTVDNGISVDPVQKTITFTNVTLYKDDPTAAVTTLNGVLRY